MKKLSDYNHPYYCSETNYHSNEASTKYETFSDFYEDFKDADIDMNLIFRFDIREREKSDRCYAEIFVIHQGKGVYHPIIISYFDKKDEEIAKPFLLKHWNHLKKMWQPISIEDAENKT